MHLNDGFARPAFKMRPGSRGNLSDREFIFVFCEAAAPVGRSCSFNMQKLGPVFGSAGFQSALKIVFHLERAVTRVSLAGFKAGEGRRSCLSAAALRNASQSIYPLPARARATKGDKLNIKVAKLYVLQPHTY